MVIIGVQEHVEHGEVLHQLADELPGLLTLRRQDCPGVLSVAVAPVLFPEKLKALVVPLRPQELLND